MIVKKFLKKIIAGILNFEARLIIKKYKPEIISITGSVGKTSSKEAVCAVLLSRFNVRKSEKSQNSELGVPLTIIGESNPWYSPVGWLKVIFNGAGLIFKTAPNYPEKIILEMGVDRPGDIMKLARFKPRVSIITAIGEIPTHVEFFSGSEDVAREKSRLVEILSVQDWAILNTDDDAVLDMKEKTRAKILTFGFGEDANVRASEYKLTYGENNKPEGITFKMDYSGSSVPVRIPGSFGKQSVYAALAGAAAGITYGMNLVEISEALSRYESPPGRMRLVEGEKETWILDDTYNASPQAMHAAIDVLKDLPAKRKIAVLGDMLEIGKFTIQSHQKAGDQLKNIADMVITCGPRAKFIARELLDHRFGAKKVISVYDSREAGRELERIIEPGDLILVKGSQAMRMERVVEEIMAYPEKKSELLVRQEPEWLNKE
ncbi:MAG: hypothetical protein A2931_03875 [Candidatus Niyogibacteria bacterium RIFCSPLOWO2_01_FULL_45_48]|uniref:UDP-N-acetylmuramoyl-tripeptide--D-alanyl-D-alanine ligase n=2 Tax=Candidatus Niyogiibacteriota TaxID=1817912 RepID=A0A1G2EXX4_9BACT|nr:MAG: hypothetical protein A2835_00835 [Candidatus Niyogibacteria bacterium RIFCSPHIGHO2_01_FULL_45_28]OGZ30649.1 MAG: hypothetical protein A3J00_00575 [Candidatus Niyogibacteria bacterium RIFCSPLOWO2_02_FULL_45_13]OGZ31511.1 MAG: hypothetical protein A2931_03875 [Candidatus Niyogibacteria bacterium RIFCSPLOWO2_01_FULL_45_48]